MQKIDIAKPIPIPFNKSVKSTPIIVIVKGINCSQPNLYIEVNSELYFKVGIATDIGKRLLSLQTGNPFEINLYYEKYFKDNVFKIEKECHKSIYSYNIRGEWFKIDMDKANEIKLYLESLNG